MSKTPPISGFPEWLPEQKLVEERIISSVKSIYAAYGFVPIETPAVEWLSSLSSKGVVEREIYVVKRLHAQEGDEADIGLHFDLTVPLARYVAQHYNDLIFPFKRYQLQKVWRGERPQRGRFREFYQFDIDIIARDELPLACDAEILTVMDKAFLAIGVGPHQTAVNNRKLLLGGFMFLGLSEAQSKQAVIAVDKLYKLGRDGVRAELTGGCGLSSATADEVIDFVSCRAAPSQALARLQALGVSHALFEEGVHETLELFRLVPESTLTRVTLDLSLARGLEYYTGTLFEIQLKEFPEFGSLGGGGRYADLASQFINKSLPGVGASIGITRLMDLIITHKLLECSKRSLTQVLVAVYDETQRVLCNEVAERMRACGVMVEVFFRSPKLGRQIEYADSKGIPFILFVDAVSGSLEVKDLQSKEQQKVPDLEAWCREVLMVPRSTV